MAAGASGGKDGVRRGCGAGGITAFGQHDGPLEGHLFALGIEVGRLLQVGQGAIEILLAAQNRGPIDVDPGIVGLELDGAGRVGQRLIRRPEVVLN